MSFETVGMLGGEDWVMRPVMRGLCRYESLVNGTLTLCDILLMNEAIDVDIENRLRTPTK